MKSSFSLLLTFLMTPEGGNMPSKSFMNHLKHLILLACFSSTATAQIPVLTPPGSCGTPNPIGATASEADETDHLRDFYSLSGFFSSSICEEYTYAGWGETMKLQLGEGAEPYRELIELAVQTWNEAVLELWG